MSKEKTSSQKLGLFQASVVNMIDMVGIGPFVVLPLVIGSMGGPYFLYAWIAGAFLAFMDAMIWGELGAAYPKAGGSYNYLREAFGPRSWGLMLSFLFVWQTLIQAPLVVASGSIAFSQYLSYLVPMSGVEMKLASGAVVVLVTILLYRRIDKIGKISTFLWVGVVLTLLLIIFGGFWKGNMLQPLKQLNDGLVMNPAFYVVLGAASVQSMYCYMGYYNISYIGDEIRNPGRNIPRSMFLSIAGVSVLYLLMNISVTSVIPWQVAEKSKYVISIFAEKIIGKDAGVIVTILILWVALSSLFAVLLGYSRVPYAAAKEGDFLPVFAKTHPKKGFPHVSLLFLAALGFIFSLLFKLEQVIDAILAMRIIIQFVGQGIGLVLLRKNKGKKHFPYRMPLYPVPIIIAVGMWLAIFISTGITFMLAGGIVIAAGLVVYFVQAYINKKWPFAIKKQAKPE